jgi:hypothetical protein
VTPAAILAAALAVAPADTDAALRQVVADYVGLYRKDTLDRWRALFHPGFTAAHVGDDGGVVVRTLDQFFAAQKRYLDTGRAVREELANVNVDRRGSVAGVTADFILTDEGEVSRGRLALVLMLDGGAWRIQSLAFAYQ